MNYNGTVYRPPTEAGTFLIPVTEGCTHNSCAFCNMYRDVKFRMLPLADLEDYLQEARAQYGRAALLISRVYLVGANPFALSRRNLLARTELIRRYFPNVSVFTMYARVDNVKNKTDEDLRALREAGVNDLYMGIESGLDDVLSRMNKGFTSEDTRRQCARLGAAGIRHYDLLMLGMAGKGRSAESAAAASALENEIRPAGILVTTISAFSGTPLNDEIQAGRFTLASEKENLQEEIELLAGLHLPETRFWAMHPINAAGVDGILKEKKSEMLAELTASMQAADDGTSRRIAIRGTQ